MLTEDLDQHGSTDLLVSENCVGCNANNRERVTVPHSVIMDAVLAPVSAEEAIADDRITSTSTLDTEPSKPSAGFKAGHLTDLARDLRNARRIPFNPWAPNVDTANLRDRPSYAEFGRRYLEDLPESSTLDPDDYDFGPAEEETEADDPNASTASSSSDGNDGDVTGLHLVAADGGDLDYSAANVDDTIAWIGESVDRAELVLATETGDDGKNRKGVIAAANAVIASATTDTEEG